MFYVGKDVSEEFGKLFPTFLKDFKIILRKYISNCYEDSLLKFLRKF